MIFLAQLLINAVKYSKWLTRKLMIYTFTDLNDETKSDNKGFPCSQDMEEETSKTDYIIPLVPLRWIGCTADILTYHPGKLKGVLIIAAFFLEGPL